MRFTINISWFYCNETWQQTRVVIKLTNFVFKETIQVDIDNRKSKAFVVKNIQKRSETGINISFKLWYNSAHYGIRGRLLRPELTLVFNYMYNSAYYDIRGRLSLA